MHVMKGYGTTNRGGGPGEGIEQSDVVTEEEVNAIIAGYPRMEIEFLPVSEFPET